MKKLVVSVTVVLLFVLFFVVSMTSASVQSEDVRCQHGHNPHCPPTSTPIVRAGYTPVKLPPGYTPRPACDLYGGFRCR